ncbi:hypothetical protein J5N97_000623 [Dioscorea zingiberensis]|uniref:Ubiquinol-cytochrome c chaperone domain-containing protein n=1 Tax=Dioscorea zingiberensis TaxID=325984 RepID=A0A9D5BS95_9LILI|nr:hypothetical protein J5N97_000623 [Dioscorea zingiberensis]
MLSRWRSAASNLSTLGLLHRLQASSELYPLDRCYSKVTAAAAAPAASSPASASPPKRFAEKPEVRLNAMFWSKPTSLALAPNSPLRIEEPKFEGFRYIMLKLLLFYSKQSKSIRGANVVYPTDHFTEGKEGSEFGQYLYEIYNHDLELRVSKAGVNLLLTKWMKELEKIFYGNIVAYDAAMSPDARHNDLANVIWRNVFSDDGAEDVK